MAGAAFLNPPAHPHPFLPYGRQALDEQDIAAVVEVLRSDWLTTGPLVERFEDAFAARVEAPHAVACANGTAALHLAALALGLTSRDIVIVPAVTFLATANAPHATGAQVIFADVHPQTGLMMPEHLEAAISTIDVARLRAVFPVHLGGQVGDPKAIRDICDAVGCAVVEDACHALGTDYDRDGDMVRVGSCADSDLTVFSFHPVKTITTGEGGMVTGRDEALMARVRRFRSHGVSHQVQDFENHALAFDDDGAPNPWYYEMAAPGLNYRLSDLQCALGLSQLARLDVFVQRRRRLVQLYEQALAPLQECVRPAPQTAGCKSGYHLFIVHIDFAKAGISRGRLMRELRARGIGSQVHYIPVPFQPYYRRQQDVSSLVGARDYYASCLSLPLFPGMQDEDVQRVCETLAHILRGATR